MFDLNKTKLRGLPDGMTIDAYGNLWIALYGGSSVSIQNNAFKKCKEYIWILYMRCRTYI